MLVKRLFSKSTLTETIYFNNTVSRHSHARMSIYFSNENFEQENFGESLSICQIGSLQNIVSYGSIYTYIYVTKKRMSSRLLRGMCAGCRKYNKQSSTRASSQTCSFVSNALK